MSTSAIPVHRARPVLADALPASRVRDALLVAAGALATALLAQVAIPVPPSPVPVTGQTLAVVLAGSCLGARRGAASQLLYVLLGLVLPVYADGGQGLEVLWGASGGYLLGFVLAAGAIGWMAERGADRRMSLAVPTFLVGQLLVFGIGVPWLKLATGMSWSTAFQNGFVVFLLGGLIKALLAGVLTPSAWRLVRRLDQR